MAKFGDGKCDGEACVLDEMGRSDFDRFQARARRRCWYEGADPVDLLFENDVDVTQLPLVERKSRLASVFKNAVPGVLFVSHFDNELHDISGVFREAVVPFELEGLVAKRKDSVYVPGVRTANWVKIKRRNAIRAQRFQRGPKSKDISIGQ